MSYERENIKQMSGYSSGEQPEDGNTLKLNTNENPYPPSDLVTRAIQQFKPTELRRYPPPTAATFRQLTAKLHKLDVDNIIATRGGDELLRLVITTFVDPGEPIGVTDPTYSLYPVLAEIQDCPLVEVGLLDDWGLPDNFADTMNSSGVKLTLLVNPHAPSGALLPIQTIRELANQLDSILLLDEAYIDFVEEDFDTPSLVQDHPNLIILRTLSKGYSLAGLRFGYGIGSAELIHPILYKTRDSYNTDYIAQQLAAAAIQSRDYAENTWEKVREERVKLADALRQLGFSVSPSQANFLLATLPDGHSAELLYQQLKSENILVRFFDQERLRDKLRISVGTPAENATLLAALIRKFT